MFSTLFLYKSYDWAVRKIFFNLRGYRMATSCFVVVRTVVCFEFSATITRISKRIIMFNFFTTTIIRNVGRYCTYTRIRIYGYSRVRVFHFTIVRSSILFMYCITCNLFQRFTSLYNLSVFTFPNFIIHYNVIAQSVRCTSIFAFLLQYSFTIPAMVSYVRCTFSF